MTFRDDNLDNRTDSKASRAANKAFGSHDEPATTGDRVGEATGGVAGAATGAALGSLGGPIGTIVGGIAGAVGGWWTGRAISEAASTYSEEDDQYYRQHFESTRGAASGSGSRGTGVGGSYESARPAYQLGYLAGMNPDYADRRFDEVEPDLQRGWSGSRQGDWSDVRDYARSAYERGQERRIVLSKEELAIGRRQVQAGEVELRKVVETEHVQERVPVTREEVTIERRPLAADAGTDVQIGEDEIRIPVMEEEVIVEKRVVPTEEVVVRKEAVTEDRTVEADLRRERVDYDENELSRSADRAASATGKGRGKGRGVGDRIADAVDDVKDRVDGNPSSRPGPDATDSRI
jgi:uncharacterized protein (TIGR02271 family)